MNLKDNAPFLRAQRTILPYHIKSLSKCQLYLNFDNKLELLRKFRLSRC